MKTIKVKKIIGALMLLVPTVLYIGWLVVTFGSLITLIILGLLIIVTGWIGIAILFLNE